MIGSVELDYFSVSDIETAARTVYGEARGETEAGKIAVAWVILNRANKGGWWGNNVNTVCVFPWQFSCWNKNDPNRAKIQKVGLDDESLRQCLLAVASVFSGLAPDPTDGSTHYHAAGVNPAWAVDHTPAAIIGAHVFYNTVS